MLIFINISNSDYGKDHMTPAEATEGWYYPTVERAWVNVTNAHTSSKQNTKGYTPA